MSPSPSSSLRPSIAVLLPCRNDAETIGRTVRGFAAALPDAAIHVFDSDSSDATAREAGLAGARVFRATNIGTAGVVSRMFADIEADIYVVARSDGGCDPSDAPSLVNALITERVDMVVGARPGSTGLYRRRDALRGDHIRKLGSQGALPGGYLVATRRFVKCYPALSPGLDIERDMRIHAEQLSIPVAEIVLNERRIRERPAPRQRFSDFVRAAWIVASATREARPFAFYAGVAALFWLAGLVLIVPELVIWISDDQHPATARTIIATGLLLSGVVAAGCGGILESLHHSRLEQKRVRFLSVPALGAPDMRHHAGG